MLSLLGLCVKAGKLVSGETAVLNAVRSGEAKLVVIASDASENTRKRFTDKCRYYGIETMSFATKDELSRAIGKRDRAVVAVTDEGFAKALYCKRRKENQNG